MHPASVNRHGNSLHRFRSVKKPAHPAKKIFLIAGSAVLLGVLWLGGTAFSAVSKITEQSDRSSPLLKFFGETVQPDLLQGEGDGRINILFIGIGGVNHKGGLLADTIMVASIDPQNKKLALLSLPRDLRVPIPGDGQDKINSAHSHAESNEKGTGPKVMKDVVSTTLDLPIHYYVRADFAGFEKFVDAIGGIEIDVPKALNDPLYPDTRLEGFEPFFVKAGVQTMNGKTALKYARSRQTTSDFDRAARQQLILLAVRDKVLSLDVLANPKRITEIIDVLGDHVRMDMSFEELQRLATIVSDIDSNAIATKVLDNSADGPLMSISEGGYYLVPRSGNFKEIQRIAHELFTDPYLVREKAKIEILNGTGSAGAARELELDLEALGYDIVSIAATDPVEKTQLTDFSGGSVPFTLRFLADRTEAEVRTEQRPADVSSDLRLVLGKNYTPSTE